MRKSNVVLLIVISSFLIIIKASAQHPNKADSLYKIALNEYDNQNINKAIEGFEKVLTVNPQHLDALFNLASLSYQQGQKEKGIELFQRAAALGDQQSKSILKDKLHIRLNYADTMSIDDVDKKPMLIVGDSTEELIINKTLNKNLLNPLVEKIAKSSVIRQKVLESKAKNDGVALNKVTGARLTLGIYFNKDGSIYNQVNGYDPESRKLIQAEVNKQSQGLGKVTPGEYDGKPVTVRGFSFPINFYPEEPAIKTKD